MDEINPDFMEWVKLSPQAVLWAHGMIGQTIRTLNPCQPLEQATQDAQTITIEILQGVCGNRSRRAFAEDPDTPPQVAEAALAWVVEFVNDSGFMKNRMPFFVDAEQ